MHSKRSSIAGTRILLIAAMACAGMMRPTTSPGALTRLTVAAIGGTEDQLDKPDTPRRIVVVVSKKNPVESVTSDELHRIFLRRKTKWNARLSVTVYERSVDHAIRQDFSQRILNKKPSELKEYWMNLQMTRGLKPPKVLRSPTLVKRYLQRVRGGISYLYEDEVDDTIRILEITRQ